MTNLSNYLQIDQEGDVFTITYDTVDLIVTTETRTKTHREGDGYHFPITTSTEADVNILGIELMSAQGSASVKFNERMTNDLANIIADFIENNVELQIA